MFIPNFAGSVDASPRSVANHIRPSAVRAIFGCDEPVHWMVDNPSSRSNRCEVILGLRPSQKSSSSRRATRKMPPSDVNHTLPRPSSAMPQMQRSARPSATRMAVKRPSFIRTRPAPVVPIQSTSCGSR